MDLKGNIWVVGAPDPNNVAGTQSEYATVYEFNCSGTLLQSISYGFGSGPGQFSTPGTNPYPGIRNLGIDSSDNLYLTDIDAINFKVVTYKFASDGRTLLATFVNPMSGAAYQGSAIAQIDLIAVDPNGNLFMADAVYDHIYKFDPNGNYLATIGSDGTGVGQFNGQSGQGAFGPGTANGPVYYQIDMTTDSSGNVFATDTFNGRTEEFDNYGTIIGQMPVVTFLAADATGNIWAVTEPNPPTPYLTEFSNSGSILNNFTYPYVYGGAIFVVGSPHGGF